MDLTWLRLRCAAALALTLQAADAPKPQVKQGGWGDETSAKAKAGRFVNEISGGA